MSFAEFLAWLPEQPQRYQFVAGEVFAMGGGTRAHSRVAMNVGAALNAHLRGTGCRTYTSDMMVRIEAVDAAYFPDLSVSCEPGGDALMLREPKLIVEVLSPATEAFDRGRKFRDYRCLQSLQEYVLIDPDNRVIEAYRRQGGDWLFHTSAGDEIVHFDSVGLTMTMADCFVDVE